MPQAALKRNDNEKLLADVSGVDWDRIVAMELMYHRSCWKAYTRDAPKRELVDVPLLDAFYDEIRNRVIVNQEIIELCDILPTYKEITKSDIIDIRTLSNMIIERLEMRLVFGLQSMVDLLYTMIKCPKEKLLKLVV